MTTIRDSNRFRELEERIQKLEDRVFGARLVSGEKTGMYLVINNGDPYSPRNGFINQDDYWVKSFSETRNGVQRIAYLIGSNDGITLDSVKCFGESHQNVRIAPCGVLWLEEYFGGPAVDWWKTNSDVFEEFPTKEQILTATSVLEATPKDGPFQYGYQWDKNGNAPGGDWALTPYPDKGLDNAHGRYMLSLLNKQTSMRCRVFLLDSVGVPYHRSYPQGYWMSREYVEDSQFPYSTFDSEHAPRGWRAASIIQDHDPLAKWVMECWYMKAACQYHDPHRPFLENRLYHTAEQALRQTKIELRDGLKGTRYLGRAGAWAYALSWMSRDSFNLFDTFYELETLSRVDGECYAEYRDNYPNYGRPNSLKGKPVAMTHEIAILAGVNIRYGYEYNYREVLPKLSQGKLKVYGEDVFDSQYNGYLELMNQDLSNYGGSYREFLEHCSKQPLLDSSQPFWYYTPSGLL